MGFQILRPQMNFGVKFLPEKDRKDLLSAWQDRLEHNIWTEQPLANYFNLADFDMRKGLQLKDEIVSNKSKEENAPTVGQHLGLPLRTPWNNAL